MASDTEMVDINNVRTHGFANYINTPARLGRTADAPAQLAGHKRPRLDFEPPREILEPTSRTISLDPRNRRVPGAKPKEHYGSDDPPVQRKIKLVGTYACSAVKFAGTGINKAYHFIRRHLFAPRDPTQIIPTQQIASVDVGNSNKRRAVSVLPQTGSVVPGSYPSSPAAKKSTSPTKDVPVPSTNDLKLPDTNHVVMVSQHDTTAPFKKPEIGLNGPTPPDSRPSSSSSSQPSGLGSCQYIAPPTVSEKVFPVEKKRQESIKIPQVQRSQKPMRRGYRQPFNLEPYEPTQIKSILKDTDRNAVSDKRINDLIRRSRMVTIESPEEKAVRHTYRQRKNHESDQWWSEVTRLRNINEERLDREFEAKQIAEVRALQAEKAEKADKQEKAQLQKKAEERKLKEAEEEISRLELADRQRQEERLRDEAELKQKIKDLAEQREKDRLQKEAEERKQISELQIASSPTTDDLIATLSSEWEAKINQAMAVKNPTHSVVNTVDGAELSRKDFGTLLPQEGTNDNPTGWLNDEIVNGFMGAIVASKKEHTRYQKSKGAPAFESYPTGWLSTYKSKGIRGIERWSKRKGIQGKALLNAERIYFPVNESSHWTLLIVSPKERKIEYLDSLNSATRANKFFGIAREWLAMELKEAYNAVEWMDQLESVSQRQRNMNDCGVFTCFNALANAKSLPYDIVDPGRMPEARRLLAAVLIKQGFNEDMNLE